MDDPLSRYSSVLNMKVIRLTGAEAALAQSRFDKMVKEKTTKGVINSTNYPWLYKGLWADAHFGADAVEVVPDEVILEPLTHSADGKPIEAPPAVTG